MKEQNTFELKLFFSTPYRMHFLNNKPIHVYEEELPKTILRRNTLNLRKESESLGEEGENTQAAWPPGHRSRAQHQAASGGTGLSHLSAQPTVHRGVS